MTARRHVHAATVGFRWEDERTRVVSGGATTSVYLRVTCVYISMDNVPTPRIMSINLGHYIPVKRQAMIVRLIAAIEGAGIL